MARFGMEHPCVDVGVDLEQPNEHSPLSLSRPGVGLQQSLNGTASSVQSCLFIFRGKYGDALAVYAVARPKLTGLLTTRFPRDTNCNNWPIFCIQGVRMLV
jgi:hypothetical protein